jgi:predicted GH43/DUF377 family glycosyl hydrolase
MIKRKIILEATENEFEANGVLNPGCFREGDFIHMFYRAFNSSMNSSIGYAKLNNKNEVIERYENSIIEREFDYERQGVEDPRIIKIDDIFYIFYVVYDGKNALTAYATSPDLKKITKRGLIGPKMKYSEVKKIINAPEKYIEQADLYIKNIGEDVLFWSKDVLLFPEKINGKFYMMIRVLPEIQIISFNDFSDLTDEFWESTFKNLKDNIVIKNEAPFGERHVGGGCPPIKTSKGWLIIFHSVDNKRVYHTSVALLDLNNPLKVIARLEEPLFSPTEEWEKEGVVSNVVFATGASLFGDKLYIYYGAADKRIGVAEIEINNLLSKLC